MQFFACLVPYRLMLVLCELSVGEVEALAVPIWIFEVCKV